MLGEMALAVPGVGSFTEYARIGLGNWAGFTSGWLYWYFWVIVVAVEAVAGAAILQRWIPAPVWVIGLVLLSVLTVVNLLSVKSYGEFEFWFASIKVARDHRLHRDRRVVCVRLRPYGQCGGESTAHRGFLPFGAMSVFAAVPTVIFAVGGAEIATIAAAESDDPAKSVAAMTRSVILRVITFYVGSMFLIACIVPWTSIVTGHSPFVAALETMRIPGAADIMNAIVLVAVLSALNSGLYVSSRILFRLAETRRCAEVAAEADAPQGAATGGAAEQRGRLCGDRRGHRVAAGRVPVPRECVGRRDAVRLSRDGAGANPHPPAHRARPSRNG